MKHRNSAGLLFAALLLTFSACGETASPGASGAPASDAGPAAAAETEPAAAYSVPEPDIPDLDYGGAVFTIASTDASQPYYSEKWMFSDGLNGETVNDAVFNRNLRIENRLNIKMKCFDPALAFHQVAPAVDKLILAGDPGVDVADESANALMPYVLRGEYLDLASLPYVRLDEDHWGKLAREWLTAGGKVFLMPNDLSMEHTVAGSMVYFNAKLIEDYGMESPYDLVDRNEWTLDTFVRMVRAVSEDLNGDGKMDYRDRFGDLDTDIGNLATGCGIFFSGRDENGRIVLDESHVERAQSMIDKVSAVREGNCMITYSEVGKNGDGGMGSIWLYGRSLFTTNQFLFFQGGAERTDELRGMKDDFGLAPNPKFDEAQESYYHRADQYCMLFAVPVSCSDPERAAAFLEYGGWLSHETVYPAYFETSLKNKIVRDPRDLAILDIVKSTTYYDLATLCCSSISDMLTRAFETGSYVTSIAKYEKKILGAFDDANAKIAAID